MRLAMIGLGRMILNYAAGTWGPDVAEELPAREGARWREP